MGQLERVRSEAMKTEMKFLTTFLKSWEDVCLVNLPGFLRKLYSGVA